ncbi:hypothetical protein [Streptomyces sp. KMM 9044]|uniref:hypothetical protein n=1 Tax=Streptomyces sp. KMM 9044 TaxID=2744474 RepID=UPI002151474D|nr:hypothetical protein [Streptomyces sp. KMM 9044]WAX80325.1 hypothetical protein HUV60_024365 [Streptomyces sp. KMM 9044]
MTDRTRRPGGDPLTGTPRTPTTPTPTPTTTHGTRDGAHGDLPQDLHGDPRRDAYEKGARAGTPDLREDTGTVTPSHESVDSPGADRSRTGGTPETYTSLDGRHDGDRAPGTAHGPGLLPLDEGDKLSAQLQHAVAGFVDAPRDSVEEADRLLEELAAGFTEAVTERRRTLRRSWQTAEVGEGPNAAETGTEQLRLALRDYRELADRLLRA